jgi:hypothetical protein
MDRHGMLAQRLMAACATLRTHLCCAAGAVSEAERGKQAEDRQSQVHYKTPPG